MTMVTVAQCTSEIIRLHDFFQAWFTGAVVETDEHFARFAGVMDEQFTIVGPNGVLTELPALTKGLRGAYGKQPGIRIWTQNHRLRQQFGDTVLCTYEEWQETAEATTARLSSVFFQQVDGAPYGVVWLHVHETWMRV